MNAYSEGWSRGWMRLMLVLLLSVPLALVGAGSATAGAYTDYLKSGERLNPGEEITSINGLYGAIMQGDGNLVLYKMVRGQKVAIWSTLTHGRPGAFLQNQGDGNLVIYHNGVAIWESRTNGRGSSMLIVQNDGNLVLYGPNRTATWHTRTYSSESPPRCKASLDGEQDIYSGQVMRAPNRGPQGTDSQLNALGRVYSASTRCGTVYGLIERRACINGTACRWVEEGRMTRPLNIGGITWVEPVAPCRAGYNDYRLRMFITWPQTSDGAPFRGSRDFISYQVGTTC